MVVILGRRPKNLILVTTGIHEDKILRFAQDDTERPKNSVSF
jgi:hypothetical protein